MHERSSNWRWRDVFQLQDQTKQHKKNPQKISLVKLQGNQCQQDNNNNSCTNQLVSCCVKNSHSKIVITIIKCNIFVVSSLVYRSIMNGNFHYFLKLWISLSQIYIQTNNFLNWFLKINSEFNKLGMELEKKKLWIICLSQETWVTQLSYINYVWRLWYFCLLLELQAN